MVYKVGVSYFSAENTLTSVNLGNLNIYKRSVYINIIKLAYLF